MSDEVAAHPVVATLAAAIVQDAQGLHFRAGAFDAARDGLRGVAGDDVVVHLVALGIKTKRIAGEAALPILIDLMLLVSERLGSTAAAADRFAAAGLDRSTAATIGARLVSRAPEEKKPPPGPVVKPKRGLG